MDFVKTLQSFEDAVFEIAMWVLLLPKTFFQIIFKPRGIRDYVTKEWEKKSEDRFQEYLSPVLFWILIAVIPYSWSFILRSRESPSQLDDPAILASVFLLLLTPIAYTVAMQRVLRKPINKTSIKRFFYIQCYCFAPIQFFSIVLNMLLEISFDTFVFPLQFSNLLIAISISNDIPSNFLLGARIFLLILFFWQIFLESLIFRQELKIEWMKATTLVLLVQIIIALITLPFSVVAKMTITS